LAFVAPVGVHAEPWCAEAHLASPFGDGPLVVIDGTVPEEQPLERWSDDEQAPLDMAAGGTLVVRHAQALPRDTQRYVASALPRSTGLIMVTSAPPAQLVEGGHLDEHLCDRVAGRVLHLPALRERAEDLRPLASYLLARASSEIGREALGLSLEAQRVINEHEWPGNETELEAVLLRAALLCDGPSLDAGLLESIIGQTVIPPAVSS
jgi:DNA-binding NtrC family response regulator